jgi:hypothetical protein
MRNMLLMLLTTGSAVTAQEYHLITDEAPVYDVEVIVFARLLGQPDAGSLNSRTVSLDVPYRLLTELDESWPLFAWQQPEIKAITNTGGEADNWQVPIEEAEPETEALVWFRYPGNATHPVTQRLAANPGLQPLWQQKWRQPATPFLAPEYVHVSSIWVPPVEPDELSEPADQFTEPSPLLSSVNANEETLMTDEVEPMYSEPQYPDFTFDGAVAFSEQRFTHIQVRMNFYRQDSSGQMITYSMEQKSRITLGEWHYFDHQQFGVLTKVMPVAINPEEIEQP